MDRLNYLLNPMPRLQQFLPVIIKLIAENYDAEGQQLIEERKNKIFWDLSSTPSQQSRLENELTNGGGLNKTALKFQDLLASNSQGWLRSYSENICDLLSKKFNVEINFEDFTKYQQVLRADDQAFSITNMFSDTFFNAGYIDAFSSDMMMLLEDQTVPEFIKDSIKKDQQRVLKFLRLLGINIDHLDANLIDSWINHRGNYKKAFLTEMVKDSTYGREIQKKINEFTGTKNYKRPDQIAPIFLPDDWSGICYRMNVGAKGESLPLITVKVPIARLFNQKSRFIDEVIIHELIHALETKGKRCGIRRNIPFTNEIRTQKLAKKVAGELHALGIFVFDDPKDYAKETEKTSGYDDLFDFVGTFFEDHQNFNDIAIKDQSYSLDWNFGADNYALFEKQLAALYLKIKYFAKHDIPFEQMPLTEEIRQFSELIDKMNEHDKKVNHSYYRLAA